MPNYLIKKDKKTGEIIYMEYKLNGYNFKPRNNSGVNFSLEKIVIIKPEMIDKILSLKIKKRLDKIIKLTMYLLNQGDDDSNPADVMLALNEISKLRSQILNKYQNYLSQQKEMLFLKKLRILENELRIKNLSMQELTSYKTIGRNL